MVYILDTGVRVSHEDFGGRAEAGWSAGCPTGSEHGCGDASQGWLYQGEITAETSQCNGHGTHCASTAGGSNHGVAEGTIIVTVQAVPSLPDAAVRPSPSLTATSPPPGLELRSASPWLARWHHRGHRVGGRRREGARSARDNFDVAGYEPSRRL